MIDRKYDAFISYRHSELDMYIAKTIEKKLETFKLPKALHEKASRTKSRLSSPMKRKNKGTGKNRYLHFGK